MLKVSTSVGGLQQIVERLKTRDKNKLQTIIGNTIENGIITGANKGIDIDGNQFEAYTEQYAKYGRLKKGYATHPVDLRRTGDLLNSIEVKQKGILTTVTVSEDQIPKAEGLLKKRKWFGISTKTKEEIKDLVREWIGSIIK